MKLTIFVILLAETNAIKLRGMYQQQRNMTLENKANEYFIDIYTELISYASLSDNFNNYTFYEYGCIPLIYGMIDDKFIGHHKSPCKVHEENIEYYTNAFMKNGEYILDTIDGSVSSKYNRLIYDVLKIKEDLKHYNIGLNEINDRIVQKLIQHFTDIVLKKTISRCCIEYTITW